MPIEIEKDIPIPESNTAGRPAKYPLARMEVGDSFVVDLETNKYQSIKSAIHASANRQGIKACIRTINDNQVRVWRIE